MVRGGAQLDINFQVMDEQDNMIISDSQRSNNRFFFTPQVSGDYKICIDNSFSTISSKVVYFDYYSADQMDVFNKHERKPNPVLEAKVAEAVQEQEMIMDMKVQDIQEVVQHIKQNLRGSSYNQGQFRNLEFKDRKLAERNYDLVNNTSLFSVIAIFTTAVFQVVIIRSIFGKKKSASSKQGIKLGL